MGTTAAVLSAILALALALLVLVLQRGGVLPGTPEAAFVSVIQLGSGGWRSAVPAAAVPHSWRSVQEEPAPAASAQQKQRRRQQQQQQEETQETPVDAPLGHWPNCSTTLPIFHWDRGDPSTLNRVLLLRQPTLLVGAPSDGWRAQDWTMSSVRGAFGNTVPNVILSRHPRLYYYNKAFPMFKTPPLQQRRWREPYSVKNLSSDEFFKLVQTTQQPLEASRDQVGGTLSSRNRDDVSESEQRLFAYFSSQIGKLPKVVGELFASDLQPPFVYHSDGQRSDGGNGATDDVSHAWRPSLWVGSAGTVAHLHWDARCALVFRAAVCPASFACSVQ
eukprot:COSAG02_NODE_4906_length_4847_cov_7.816133_6_plen_332_part_00